jgi:hypothetical protein
MATVYLTNLLKRNLRHRILEQLNKDDPIERPDTPHDACMDALAYWLRTDPKAKLARKIVKDNPSELSSEFVEPVQSCVMSFDLAEISDEGIAVRRNYRHGLNRISILTAVERANIGVTDMYMPKPERLYGGVTVEVSSFNDEGHAEPLDKLGKEMSRACEKVIAYLKADDAAHHAIRERDELVQGMLDGARTVNAVVKKFPIVKNFLDPEDREKLERKTKRKKKAAEEVDPRLSKLSTDLTVAVVKSAALD